MLKKMKRNYREIILKAKEYRNIDKKCDDALKNYLNTIAPDTRNFTFHENSQFVGFLRAVEYFDKVLADWLSYFFYECDEIGCVKTADGKEYEFWTVEGFITFIEIELWNQ